MTLNAQNIIDAMGGVERFRGININKRTDALAWTLYLQAKSNGAGPHIFGAGMFQLGVIMALRSPEWARAYTDATEAQCELDDNDNDLNLEDFAFNILAVQMEDGSD